LRRRAGSLPFSYETSPNEKTVVYALARRAGEHWLFVIMDGALSTFGERNAALSLAIGSLRPKGFERERFAERNASDAERIALLKEFIQDVMRRFNIPGVGLGLIDAGKVVFEGDLGAGISLKDWGFEREAKLPRGTPRLDSEGMALAARCPTLCPVGAALDGNLFILGGDKPVLPPARQAGRCRDRARHRSADHSAEALRRLR
jgi:hypothetical protein